MPEQEWYRRTKPDYFAARMVEEHVPQQATVFGYSGVPRAYTSREMLVGYEGARNQLIDDLIWCTLYPGQAPAGRIWFRFPRTTLRRLRIVYSGDSSEDDWAVSEVRVFDGLRELPRAPHWRLAARPNPWDVQSAFDNTSVTRWRTWEGRRAGMYLLLDFGQNQSLDQVVLNCPRDQVYSRVTLEFQQDGMDWKPLTVEPEAFETGEEPAWKTESIREAKALGADYLILNEADYFTGYFDKQPQGLPLRLVATIPGWRLYRLD
jgi:hypothetical protein